MCVWGGGGLAGYDQSVISIINFYMYSILFYAHQVFDKALDESNYSFMYAQLCLRLNDYAPPHPQTEDQQAGVSSQRPFTLWIILHEQ